MQKIDKKNLKIKKGDFASKGKEGVIWVALFHGIETILKFGSSIILARILFPEDFGMMGMASIVIQLARRLTNMGFSTVLVQLKEIKDEHYDTVFIINFVLMSSLAALVYFGAPYYGNFFESENFVDSNKLRLIIMWLSFDFVLKGLASVPGAYLKRRMKFKELGFSKTSGRTIGLAVTILLALWGHGVWSLVYGTLIGSFITKIMTFYYARWLPKFKFRWWAFKDSFSFGLWLYVGAYINYGINKVDYFFIAKFLGPVHLGFYERAFNLMSLPRKRIVRRMNKVAFATYSRIQDDQERLVRGLLQVSTYLSLVTYPFMVWLFFVAPSFITLVYGARWTETVLPLQIMCISGILDSYTLVLQPLLRAKGWVGNQARRNFIYLAVLSGAVYGGLQWGIVGVAAAIAFASVIRFGLMLNLTVKRLPLSIIKFFGAQKSAIIYSLIQIGVLLAMQWVSAPYFPKISFSMLLAVTVLSPVVFIGSHLVFRFNDVDVVLQDFSKEIKKFARKFPLIKKLSFIKKK